jgi:Type III restriction enzyme, res subunit
MATLESLKAGMSVRGITPHGAVTVRAVEWYGDQAIEVVYQDAAGAIRNRLLYRHDESALEVAAAGRTWTFDADGELLRLVSEAYRIRLAWLFDPYRALSISQVEPLPHQISAVYGEMLPRQPLRFLLAHDPGAGKTIMAGLLIKELMLRGELERCLIVSPGSLTEQWQDELRLQRARQESAPAEDRSARYSSLAGRKWDCSYNMPWLQDAAPGPRDLARAKRCAETGLEYVDESLRLKPGDVQSLLYERLLLGELAKHAQREGRAGDADRFTKQARAAADAAKKAQADRLAKARAEDARSDAPTDAPASPRARTGRMWRSHGTRRSFAPWMSTASRASRRS